MSSHLPAHRNISFRAIQKKLISSSWDIQLLRHHELLLATVLPHEIALCYIVTADKGLAQLKNMFKTQSIFIFNNNVSSPLSKLEINLLAVKDNKRKKLEAMEAYIENMQQNRDDQQAEKMQNHTKNEEIYNNIHILVEKLEKELCNLLDK